MYAKISAVKIVLKSLIIWFLLLAVPFQGFASATMLMCAPITPALTSASDAIIPATHDHAAMMAVSLQGHDHYGAIATSAATKGASAKLASSGHHTDAKCNSCAACCCGALMPPSYQTTVVIEAPNFPAFGFDSVAMPKVDLAFPERPPKPSLS